jgi:hypothetical protein
MYPIPFYINLCSLSFLTILFHYPLQYINLEKKYFERYSVNLMRSVACYMIFSQSCESLFHHGLTYDCTSYHPDHYELFYFFLAYIYYDTVLLIYQHYLGLEKKIRYDLLLHHLLAIFAFTFIQNNNLYQLTPYIGLSEGISIVSGFKLLANIFQQKELTTYCIQYRLYFLTHFRMTLLWPYILYLFYSQIGMNSMDLHKNEICNPDVYNYENFTYFIICIMMIYSAEYLWYIRGKNELRSM